MTAEEIVAELRPEAARKSVAIILKTPPPHIRIPLDRHRLPHVFSNLVRNAVDVMHRGGRIMFSFVLGERVDRRLPHECHVDTAHGVLGRGHRQDTTSSRHHALSSA